MRSRRSEGRGPGARSAARAPRAADDGDSGRCPWWSTCSGRGTTTSRRFSPRWAPGPGCHAMAEGLEVCGVRYDYEVHLPVAPPEHGHREVELLAALAPARDVSGALPVEGAHAVREDASPYLNGGVVGGPWTVRRRVRAHLIEVADVLELGTCGAHWRAPAAALATSANLCRVPLILAVSVARLCKHRRRRARGPWAPRSWPLGVPAAWVSGSRTTARHACTRRRRVPCRAGTQWSPHSFLWFTWMAVTRFL